MLHKQLLFTVSNAFTETTASFNSHWLISIIDSSFAYQATPTTQG